MIETGLAVPACCTWKGAPGTGVGWTSRSARDVHVPLLKGETPLRALGETPLRALGETPLA